MIVVTGMHRSGTSLAALILQELGLDFGPDDAMYAADDWNANGYLERLDVVDINSRAITGFNRTTGKGTQMASQISYLRMVSPHKITSRLDVMTDELQQLSAVMGGRGVKDPRFCLTLPGWKHHVEVDGLVVALRHPAAAVASLKKRNKLPEPIGHRFWRWHMRAILPLLDEQTLVLRQDELTGAESDDAISVAAAWLRQRGIESAGDASGIVDQSLVHHQPSDEGVPTESLRIWNELCAAPRFTA